jgi:hypothetical protein
MNKLNCLIIIFLLVSCSEVNNYNRSNETEDIFVDTTDEITIKDTEKQIREKLKFSAKLDGKEFGELSLYDNFFNDKIIKYYVKDYNDEQRLLTVVVYKDRLRYMKMLIQHVGDTCSENKAKHLNRIVGDLEKAIEDGTYQLSDHNYLKLSENGEIWYNAFLLCESRETKRQDYWVLMTPEADLKYLKHVVRSFQNTDGFETRFLISK